MPGSRRRARHRDNPALESFGSGKNWGLILIALFGATAPEGVVWYTGQFYALFYMTTVLKIDYVTVYIIMMIALTAAAPFFIVFGALSDRIGRRNIMTPASRSRSSRSGRYSPGWGTSRTTRSCCASWSSTW